MSFYPQVKYEIELDGITYRFTEHPAAPGMPYGQEGRAATVYQLERADNAREKIALKVLKPRFRVPVMVSLSQKMNEYASMPGLEVCSRSVLTPQANPDLLGNHPDLLYSVVMPWVFGPTWMDVIIDKRSVTTEESLEHSTALVGVLSEMEQQGVAHCDLSGPNVLLPCLSQEDVQKSSKVALVDVEQLYAPNLRQPPALPGGSPGYAHHRDSPEGLWSDDADRFAGGVLLAEMLAWCDPRLRKESWSESFFAPDEMHQHSDRYHLMVKTLRERWGEDVSRLFERVWNSGTLKECATFGEWFLAIIKHAPKAAATIETPKPESKEPKNKASTDQRIERLLDKAQKLEEAGKQKEALVVYREAQQAAPEGGGLKRELASIVRQLEKQAPSAPPNPKSSERAQAYLQLAQQAEERGDFEMAVRSYRQAAELAPDDSLKREIETILKTLEPKVGSDLSGAPPDKLIERAQELEEEGRKEEAVRSYQRAAAKLPAGSSQVKELAIIIRELGGDVPDSLKPLRTDPKPSITPRARQRRRSGNAEEIELAPLRTRAVVPEQTPSSAPDTETWCFRCGTVAASELYCSGCGAPCCRKSLLCEALQKRRELRRLVVIQFLGFFVCSGVFDFSVGMIAWLGITPFVSRTTFRVGNLIHSSRFYNVLMTVLSLIPFAGILPVVAVETSLNNWLKGRVKFHWVTGAPVWPPGSLSENANRPETEHQTRATRKSGLLLAAILGISCIWIGLSPMDAGTPNPSTGSPVSLATPLTGLAEVERLISTLEYRAALDLVDSILKKGGNFEKLAHARALRGNALLGLKENKKAEDAFSLAIKTNRSLGEAWYGRAKARFNLGKPESAFDLKQAIALGQPGAKEYLTRALGNAHAKSNWALTAALAERGLELTPENKGECLLYLGDASLHLGQKQPALEAYKRCLKAGYGPQGGSQIALTADAKYFENKYADALDIYKVLDRFDEFSDKGSLSYSSGTYYYRMAYAAAELNSRNEAITYYSKSLNVNPSNSPSWNNRGVLYSDLGRTAEAQRDFTKALELDTKSLKSDPKNANTLENRGIVLSNLDRRSEARQDLTKALELASNDEIRDRIRKRLQDL